MTSSGLVRSGSSINSPDLAPFKKNIDQFVKVFDHKTNFYSTEHPDTIEETLLTYID